MESVYAALSKRLSFQDNIQSQMKDFDFTTSANYGTASPLTDGFTPLRFTNLSGGRANGLILLKINTVGGAYTVITNPVYMDWIELEGTVFINYITGLAPSTKYKLKVLLV
jgi:hypothetical protein